MKRYTIQVPIERAEGSQIFAVNAESEEEAFDLLRGGKGEWVEDEIEVTSLNMDCLSVIDTEEPLLDMEGGEG